MFSFFQSSQCDRSISRKKRSPLMTSQHCSVLHQIDTLCQGSAVFTSKMFTSGIINLFHLSNPFNFFAYTLCYSFVYQHTLYNLHNLWNFSHNPDCPPQFKIVWQIPGIYPPASKASSEVANLLKSQFWREIINLTWTIHRGVWNLPHKFHLYLI